MELLTVVAILAILFAIGYALVLSSLLITKAADTKSRLRQIYLAVDLYRTDHDGGPVGDLGDLGLPPVLSLAKGPTKNLGLPVQTWVSGCSPHPHADPTYQTMYYFPGEGGARLAQASTDLGDRLLLVADNQCNAPEVLINAPYVTKRGLGLLLNGTLVDRRAEGDTHDPYWWSTELEFEHEND